MQFLSTVKISFFKNCQHIKQCIVFDNVPKCTYQMTANYSKVLLTSIKMRRCGMISIANILLRRPRDSDIFRHLQLHVTKRHSTISKTYTTKSAIKGSLMTNDKKIQTTGFLTIVTVQKAICCVCTFWFYQLLDVSLFMQLNKMTS